MKFTDSKGALLPCRQPKVGDVFPSKSTGPKSYRNGTRYWLLIAITPGMPVRADQEPTHYVHHFLGLDTEGNIVSTTSYGDHVMKERPRLGHCADVSTLNLKIEWEPHAL